MDRLIECSELGFVRDIPVELIKLEKQNAELIKAYRLFEKKVFTTAALVGISIIIFAIIKTIKNIKDEKRHKRSY